MISIEHYFYTISHNNVACKLFIRMSTKMKKPRGRPRSFDREEVLNAALFVFWQKGFAGTSLDDLAAAMQMNRPSIYNAFGDKESIYRLALSEFCGRLDAGLQASVASTPDIRQGLVRFFEQAVDVYCSTEPALGCLMMCTAPTEALSHPDVGKDLTALIRRVDAQLAEKLQDAIAKGTLPDTIDAGLTARALQAILHSLALRARAGEPMTALKAMARYATDYLLPSG